VPKAAEAVAAPVPPMVLEAAPAEEPATVSATAPALVIVAERLQATAIAKAELLAVMFSTGSLQLLLE